jgi:hypothetical protein
MAEKKIHKLLLNNQELHVVRRALAEVNSLPDDQARYPDDEQARSWIAERITRILDGPDLQMDPDAPKIRNRDQLLQGIADGTRSLEHGPRVPLQCLEVQLLEDDEVVLETSVSQAIDWLVNDVHTNAETDWSDADRAEVRVL